MKGLLYSESTLESKEIYSMRTHTWMSFTSHIFTSLPLVHTPNPDFLR
jgi:hypothetical protein